MLFEVCKGVWEERLVVVLEVGYWVRPIACFEHIVDALACRYPKGGCHSPDVMRFDIFREGGVICLVCPFDSLNYLGGDHLFGSNKGVTTKWYEQGSLGCFSKVL